MGQQGSTICARVDGMTAAYSASRLTSGTYSALACRSARAGTPISGSSGGVAAKPAAERHLAVVVQQGDAARLGAADNLRGVQRDLQNRVQFECVIEFSIDFLQDSEEINALVKQRERRGIAQGVVGLDGRDGDGIRTSTRY